MYVYVYASTFHRQDLDMELFRLLGEVFAAAGLVEPSLSLQAVVLGHTGRLLTALLPFSP